MKLWKKIVFVVVLVTFISLSLFFTFYSIARDTFEFEEQTSVGGIENLDGWVFYGFNGNANVKDVHIDFVRDEKGQNPDESKPVIGVDEFTIVSDEYVEFIYIGKDVRYIHERAFYYCKMLKAVFVDEENPYFTSVDGVLFTKDMKNLVLHPICNGDWLVEEGKAKTNDTYVIPDGVETIGGCSFYKNTALVHLTIPDSVKHINDMAFFGCNNMWTVWLNEGLETIGDDAFSYCWSMAPVLYIPSTVETIEKYAFYNCTGVTTVYMGAESEADLSLAESWLPKSLKKAMFNVEPEPVFGKTLDDAIAEKDRIDKLNAEEGE